MSMNAAKAAYGLVSLLGLVASNCWAQCPDPTASPTTNYQPFTLMPDPVAGQDIRISFNKKSADNERLLIYADGTWLANVLPGQPKDLTWKGGSLGYLFENCISGSWHQVNAWVPDPQADIKDIPGGASFVLRPVDTGADREKASEVALAWGNAIAAPAPQQPPPPAPPNATYVVTLGNMTVWNGVSHSIDTDYISLTVEGPNGQSWSKTYGPNNLHKKQTTNWALASPPISVPIDSTAQLKISWAAINKGHTANEDSIRDALSKAADAINQQTQQNQQNDANFLTIVVNGVKTAVGWITADCDTALFEQSAVISGSTLPNLSSYDQWSSEGPNMWHKVIDYPNIPPPSKCDTGHYNLEVHIQRTS